MEKEERVLKAELAKKKNRLRGLLKEKGILKREGRNDYDEYSYFSEAQYKLLFTELFATCGLELKFNELNVVSFFGSDKMPNGRRVTLYYELTDIETGYSEESVVTGEGLDKGDKAIYKAYTGALKYYLANTFLVATGDDAEKESPEVSAPKATTKGTTKGATAKQIELCKKLANDKDKKADLLTKISNDMGQELQDGFIEGATVEQLDETIAKCIGNLMQKTASSFIETNMKKG